MRSRLPTLSQLNIEKGREYSIEQSEDRYNGMCFVYILKCADNSYYVGSTRDIKQRLKKHNNYGVKYTKSRLPFKLIFLKKFDSYSQALKFEKKVKSWKKRKSIEKMLSKPDNIVNKFDSV